MEEKECFKSDIEIAQEAKMSHIRDIAGRICIAEDELDFTESTKQNYR